MNTFLDLVRQWPVLLLVGIIILTAFYFGKAARRVKLPSLIGFMLLGVFLGPSLLNVLGEAAQVQLSFLTEIALGFVALSIGLELKFSALKQLGKGMVSIILLESFGAFILVTVLIFWITGNLPLALVFGGIAPASAPAGTVAVIQEYKAKGPLTKALYAVVGFDDGLGIILFGFAAAIAKSILHQQAGAEAAGFGMMLWEPMKEVLLSVLFGSLLAFIFTLFARKLDNSGDIAILLTGITFIAIGLSTVFHLSLILTNLIIGMIVVNTQSYELIAKIHERLPSFMPLLFILFFTLAGANLHIDALPALGLTGIIYIFARSAGLIFGSRLGARIGKAGKTIRDWIGLGILSQAGVAIGLSLVVANDFRGIGKVLENGQTSGDLIATGVLTTITATCLFFEIIGPILTRIALKKAGEIEA
ncbi:MAG: cation:proton antiporter [Candidatus Neomarinimicrobiota bacterium]|jgi:Kef-type K+ transport system membrane component KefB|nr:cation:proton antiporter [Candidatus Neomarinimicrobiota bacterium]MDX9780937.1 cation:proton antiporter [bacterium]